MTSVLLVGHGSHLSAGSSASVYAHASTLRGTGRFAEVRVAFWKEEPSLSRALDVFDTEDITVVPVFMSRGYFTGHVIPREMGLSGRVTHLEGRTVRYTEPVGVHPGLAEVVAARAVEAGAGASDAVAILAHGTPRTPESAGAAYLQAERLAASGRFAEVTTVFLDQEPNMRDVSRLVAAEQVVLVPFFVAEGWHVGQSIPEDLALDGAARQPGWPGLRYSAPVGTHPAMAGVIEDLVAEAATW